MAADGPHQITCKITEIMINESFPGHRPVYHSRSLSAKGKSIEASNSTSKGDNSPLV